MIDKATLDQLRGLFFSDLSMGRFEVVLLARRHFQSAEALVRTHAVDYALRTLDALQLSVALDLHHRGAALEGLTVINPSDLA